MGLSKKEYARRMKAVEETSSIREAAKRLNMSETTLGFWVKNNSLKYSMKNFIANRPLDERMKMKKFFISFLRFSDKYGDEVSDPAHRFIEAYRKVY